MSLPALALLTAALAGIAMVEMEAAPPPRSAPPPPRTEATLQPQAANLGGASPAEVASVLARPLFAPDRRPDPAGPRASGDGPDLPHLTGILVTGFDRLAIFTTPSSDKADERSTVVRVGDQIGPYRVQVIKLTAVVLSGADGVHTIEPRFSNSQPVAAARPLLAVPPVSLLAPSQRDPARYGAPTGPFGIAMYSHSPAAPSTAKSLFP